jgi:hypothetical protein
MGCPFWFVHGLFGQNAYAIRDSRIHEAFASSWKPYHKGLMTAAGAITAEQLLNYHR